MKSYEKKVLDLLDRFHIGRLPIPVEEITKKLGVRLTFEPFEGKDDISGMLYKDDEDTIIGINSSHHKYRQRFSIAHEIGHLLLHRDKSLFVDKAGKVSFRDKKSSLAVDQDEIAANAFAAELLMPRKFVTKEVKGYVRNKDEEEIDIEELLEEMSKKFQVSTQAMEFRLMNLGILSSH